MWLGPAPKVPFNWNRFGVGDRWSTFRYFYDYANGWPGDWGVHLLDIVQWAMRVDGPHTITASGRKFYLKDNSDTPDTLQITLEYPEFVATYENRLCNESANGQRTVTESSSTARTEQCLWTARAFKSSRKGARKSKESE